jgi:SAM-dependent methyltransferase
VAAAPDHCFAPNLDEPLKLTANARNYNRWLYDRARPFLGSRVLDFGAGIGTFTELAADDGREVVALEPHAEYAELLRERFRDRPDVTVAERTIDALAEEASFDSALCFNVLEHVGDDAGALAAVRRRLRPGGSLLLLVPAHGFLLSETDRAIGHHRRYAKRPLRRLLADAGYEVTTLRYVNPVGAIGWLVSFRLRRGRVERWPARSYRLYDRLVPALRLLDHVSLPLGLSVWAVARRPS